MHAAEKK